MTESHDSLSITRLQDIEALTRDLDHADWAKASPVPITRYWSGREAPAGRHSEARLVWSSAGLGVRFICRQTEPLVVSAQPRLDQKTSGLWDRDVCEIFIAPDPHVLGHYFEFEAAPTGEWIDLSLTVTRDGRDSDWKFNSGMRVTAKVLKDSVVMGMWIPFDPLGHKPQAGERWRGNLFRCVGAGPKRGYLAWQPTHTRRPNFHVPEAFGWLKFEGWP
jgi:hypothetical protein